MKEWKLSPEEVSAAHDSGLIVRYMPLPMTPEQEKALIDDALLGEFSTADGRAWAMMTTPALLYTVIDVMFSRYGKEEAPFEEGIVMGVVLHDMLFDMAPDRPSRDYGVPISTVLRLLEDGEL